jgi:hypothetical protein
MLPKRLGLGLLTTVAATTLAACDSPTAATAAVAPNQLQASFARGTKPHASATSAQITMTPSAMQLTVGSGAWLRVTLYDKNGNALPDNDGSLLWYGCKPANPALDTCMGYLTVAPVYPNLRDVYVSASAAGSFTVWVDDGNGHRASSTVVVQ